MVAGDAGLGFDFVELGSHSLGPDALDCVNVLVEGYEKLCVLIVLHCCFSPTTYISPQFKFLRCFCVCVGINVLSIFIIVADD